MSDRMKRILVPLALALAALKFAIVPLLSLQDDWRDALAVERRQIAKAAALLATRDTLGAQLAQVSRQLDEAQNVFPAPAPADAARLATQQQLESLFQKLGVRIQVFNWQVDEDLPEAGLVRSRALINVSGPAGAFVAVHGNLEQAFPYVVVHEFQFNFPSGPGQDAQGTFTLDVYHRAEPAPA